MLTRVDYKIFCWHSWQLGFYLLMKWAQHDMVWNNKCEQTLVVIFYRPILSFVMPSNLVTDHTSEAKSQMQVFILVVFIFIFVFFFENYIFALHLAGSHFSLPSSLQAVSQSGDYVVLCWFSNKMGTYRAKRKTNWCAFASCIWDDRGVHYFFFW